MSAEEQKPVVYLVPAPIAAGAVQALPPEVLQRTGTLLHYFAEDLRTARRLIKVLHPARVIEQISFAEMNNNVPPDKQMFRKWIAAGHSIGIMSEAGCPGIADPGAELVALAHSMGVKVVPLTGPSAILLSLMASGLNGQSFAFNGYLPVKEPFRSKRIKELEARSAKEQQTQAFIETPYRNNPLLADLLKNCAPVTRLCIALDINGEKEFIRTLSIADWKKDTPHLEKAPAVFLLLGA